MTYEEAVSRCWVEVDLDAVRKNYASARRLLGENIELIPVLKANAYGMGIGVIAETLSVEGAKLFAVAMPNEAEQILARVKGVRVLTMGLCGKEAAERLIKAGQPLCVFNEESARMICEAVKTAGKPARVHFKIDTGLHRIGFDTSTAVTQITDILSHGAMICEGLFTHLGIHSEAADGLQIQKLISVREGLTRMGIDVPFIHAMDSIGMARYAAKGYAVNAARIGAWLYGVKPRANITEYPAFCARFRARVSQVRKVAKGELVGYDDDHPLVSDAVIATVSAGYIDGTPRKGTDWMAEINGRLAPVIGIACMDQLMIDVTDIPGVRAGDIVTFDGGMIDNEDYSKMGGFNHNESIARIGPRVPRIYFENGKPIRIETELIF